MIRATYAICIVIFEISAPKNLCMQNFVSKLLSTFYAKSTTVHSGEGHHSYISSEIKEYYVTSFVRVTSLNEPRSLAITSDHLRVILAENMPKTRVYLLPSDKGIHIIT